MRSGVERFSSRTQICTLAVGPIQSYKVGGGAVVAAVLMQKIFLQKSMSNIIPNENLDMRPL